MKVTREKRVTGFLVSLLCALLILGFCAFMAIAIEPYAVRGSEAGGITGLASERIESNRKLAFIEEDEELIDGGETDFTDYSAPKEIQSDEIVDFDASFCLFTRWKADDYDNFFHFLVREDENGEQMASEEILGIRQKADDSLLQALQEIIEKYDLASSNGVYKLTAGLAPEYGESSLTVQYASGEVLTFTMDNNPYAQWSEEVYDVFAEWFAELGDASLYPPEEDSQVSKLRLDYTRDGVSTYYGDMNVGEHRAIDGQTFLLNKSAYDVETLDDIEDICILFPEDFFENITEILEGYHLDRKYNFSYYNHDSGLNDLHDEGYFGLGDLTPADGEEDSEDLDVSLHITYESGKRIYIDTRKPSEIEALEPVLTELIEYLDTLF